MKMGKVVVLFSFLHLSKGELEGIKRMRAETPPNFPL